VTDPDVIVWYDPGLMTGVAAYDIAIGRFGSWQDSYADLPGRLDSFCQEYGERLAVGWELYIQTPRPRPGSKAEHSQRAISLIKDVCDKHGITQIKGQPSSARMVKSTVVFLRRLGWYKPGMQHANDAACHLFRHLIKMRPVPEKIRRGLPPGY
jgi:hypothetical protein